MVLPKGIKDKTVAALRKIGYYDLARVVSTMEFFHVTTSKNSRGIKYYSGFGAGCGIFISTSSGVPSCVFYANFVDKFSPETIRLPHE